VLPCEFDLAGEREVITNEDAGTRHNSCGKGLVVAVAEAQHPAVIHIGFLGMDFHEPEVALPLVGQGVGLRADAQIGGRQRLLDGVNQLVVGYGTPAVG